MTAGEIRAAGRTAVTTAQRLAIALAAVHAARPRVIRELTLDDIDLPGRRITLAGHRQCLGELTRDALLAWLGYRRLSRTHPARPHRAGSPWPPALILSTSPLVLSIDHTNAVAYAKAARNLLSSPAGQALSRHPE